MFARGVTEEGMAIQQPQQAHKQEKKTNPSVGLAVQVGLLAIVVGVLFYMLSYSKSECP